MTQCPEGKHQWMCYAPSPNPTSRREPLFRVECQVCGDLGTLDNWEGYKREQERLELVKKEQRTIAETARHQSTFCEDGKLHSYDTVVEWWQADRGEYQKAKKVMCSRCRRVEEVKL